MSIYNYWSTDIIFVQHHHKNHFFTYDPLILFYVSLITYLLFMTFWMLFFVSNYLNLNKSCVFLPFPIILILGRISTLWEWPSQLMLIWTANCVDPSTWQSSQSLRRDFMSSIILVIFSWSSDIVSILFRKTTRSASDFPFTAVPLPSDPLYNKAFSTRFKIVFNGSLKGSFWPNYIYMYLMLLNKNRVTSIGNRNVCLPDKNLNISSQ